MTNKNSSVPEVSIDEALELYLSIACPNGLPEGAEKDKILSLMREKISKDRPEWSKQSENSSKPVNEETPSRYAEIKAQIVEHANREDVPEDSEERYLYNRRKEAKENSLRKKEEANVAKRDEVLRQGVIDQKKQDDEELLRRAALIKKIILEKAGQKLSSKFSNLPPVANAKPSFEGNQRPEIKFNTSNDIDDGKVNESLRHKTCVKDSDGFSIDSVKKDVKPNADKWFKDFKSLSMDERLESVKEFNQKKREMLQSKEELMWSPCQPRKRDYGFSLEEDGFELDAGLSIDSDKKATKGFRLE